MKAKIYNYLLETMYSLPSCSTCQYNHTSHLKRLPCNKCKGWSKYKLHKGHKADLERMAREIIKIVKNQIQCFILRKRVCSMNNKDDERLRKTAISLLKDFAEQGYENAVDCIDWLEKRGEKPQGKSALEAIDEKKVDNQNCVKPTDKVEPKFKVGDRIQHKNSGLDVSILKINADSYTVKDFTGDYITIDFTYQDDYELVPDKFDINTLIPFESRVLVRDSNNGSWCPSFFGCCKKDNCLNCLTYNTIRGFYKQCIPFEGNEHLLGTTNDCSDFYKTWE